MFVELICRSSFSFLEGASSPESLVAEAGRLGMKALALVDRNGLYAAPTFYRECREAGIKPIIGAQLTLEDGDELILLCRNLQGYQKLSQLITAAHHGRSKGDPLLPYVQLAGLRGDLFCVVGGKVGLLPKLLAAGERRAAAALLKKYQTYFGPDELYVALVNHREEGDGVLCERLARLAGEAGLGVIASNDVRYAKPGDGMLCDVLMCIKQHTTLAASQAQRPVNHERYLKSGDQLRELLRDYPEALDNSCRVANQCEFILDFSAYRFPDFPVPEGHTVDSYLAELVRARVEDRYPGATEAVFQRVEQELVLIAKLKLSGYFLVVWDIVQFARRRGIPVQGRGSAANSVVTYILGITPVDPIAHNLFLGRFLHEDLETIPDIDLDFAATREEGMPNREDVIQYIYQRYGEKHVAMVCTYVTFQAKSAIREVGKVLELPEAIIDRMTKLCGRYERGDLFPEMEKMPEFSTYLKSEPWQHFKVLANQISDLPRHLGVHVGGMVIASCPLELLVPLESARMAGRVVCQWDKDMVGDAGLVKVDILGLGMLAVVRETAQLVSEAGGEMPDLERLACEDPAVYETIGRADTIGVFQVESRAQMQSLPRTRPANFHELGVQVAIIRPGPLQGNMVAPYIRRKRGEEAVTYIHRSLKPILQDTLGVILFQEQVLLCAVAIAGFSAAQADALRRAMSRKRSRDAMARLRQSFLEGAKHNRIPTREAVQVFDALEGFALYGFCKSHALAFAHLTYVSAWLKVYHPAAFLAALLNNQPMGFYPNETLIGDAMRHGVEIAPVDINCSFSRCSLKDARTVQLGFELVKGMKDETAATIVKARSAGGPYPSLRALAQRTHLRPKLIEHLIEAGACDSLGLERRELLWQLWLLERLGFLQDDLFASQELTSPELPPSTPWEHLIGEYRTLGFPVRRHPLALLRERLRSLGVIPSRALEEATADSQVAIAGMVVCRQRPPTAKGFAFLTLEDEEGLMNVVVSPQLYEAARSVFRQAALIVARGSCQKVAGVVNVRAESLEKLSH